VVGVDDRTNKLTAFVKRHKDKNMLEVNNNIVYKIFVCNNT